MNLDGKTWNPNRRNFKIRGVSNYPPRLTNGPQNFSQWSECVKLYFESFKEGDHLIKTDGEEFTPLTFQWYKTALDSKKKPFKLHSPIIYAKTMVNVCVTTPTN